LPMTQEDEGASGQRETGESPGRAV
jgi:hypothetical protein